MNIETWKKVGEQIQQYYSLHGAEKVPLDAIHYGIFSETVWTLNMKAKN